MAYYFLIYKITFYEYFRYQNYLNVEFLIPNYLIIFYSLLRLFKDGAKFNFVDQ